MPGLPELFPNEKNSDLGHQVRKRLDFLIGAQIDRPLHCPSFFEDKTFEVMNCQEVDVRRIVPIVREQLGARRPS